MSNKDGVSEKNSGYKASDSQNIRKGTVKTSHKDGMSDIDSGSRVGDSEQMKTGIVRYNTVHVKNKEGISEKDSVN